MSDGQTNHEWRQLGSVTTGSANFKRMAASGSSSLGIGSNTGRTKGDVLGVPGTPYLGVPGNQGEQAENPRYLRPPCAGSPGAICRSVTYLQSSHLSSTARSFPASIASSSRNSMSMVNSCALTRELTLETGLPA